MHVSPRINRQIKTSHMVDNSCKCIRLQRPAGFSPTLAPCAEGLFQNLILYECIWKFAFYEKHIGILHL
uniref:Uncharacterized protein n=1 Tax=Anguilla anguilla TaxID=7936 RepID=A0A0E9QEH9_ANGAN